MRFTGSLEIDGQFANYNNNDYLLNLIMATRGGSGSRRSSRVNSPNTNANANTRVGRGGGGGGGGSEDGRSGRTHSLIRKNKTKWTREGNPRLTRSTR